MMTGQTMFFFLLLGLSVGCVNLELTTQRTALENQILGEYEQIDDDLMLMTSVRAVDESGNTKKVDLSELQKLAVVARQNQQFNLDDIDELKSSQILGESNNGLLKILPDGVGLVASATRDQRALAGLLVKEENADRQTIWQRVIQQSQDLSPSDLPKIKQTFAQQQREKATPGQWIQEESGDWTQKK